MRENCKLRNLWYFLSTIVVVVVVIVVVVVVVIQNALYYLIIVFNGTLDFLSLSLSLSKRIQFFSLLSVNDVRMISDLVLKMYHRYLNLSIYNRYKIYKR